MQNGRKNRYVRHKTQKELNTNILLGYYMSEKLHPIPITDS